MDLWLSHFTTFFEFLKGLASGSIKTTSRSIGHAKTNLFHLLYSS